MNDRAQLLLEHESQLYRRERELLLEQQFEAYRAFSRTAVWVSAGGVIGPLQALFGLSLVCAVASHWMSARSYDVEASKPSSGALAINRYAKITQVLNVIILAAIVTGLLGFLLFASKNLTRVS